MERTPGNVAVMVRTISGRPTKGIVYGAMQVKAKAINAAPLAAARRRLYSMHLMI